MDWIKHYEDMQYDADIVYWMWLSIVCGAGSTAPEKLFKVFGVDARQIYNAAPEEYMHIPGLKGEVIDKLCRKTLKTSYDLIDWCKRYNVGLLPYNSEYYPNSLKKIDSAPIMLYYLGMPPRINRRLSLAVVGTRKMTDYGGKQSYCMGYDLASSGAVVVSGAALGVDGFAHRGALDAGGYTIAVLGCGIDRIYPKEHMNLIREIAVRGTVITDFCPGTEPKGKNFPVRNRIISGLSQGTVVVEADGNSGSLITANYAVKQGRPVYAMPGNIGNSTSCGTNSLIKDGAKMATNALDVLSDFAESYDDVINLENLVCKLSKYCSDGSLKNVFRKQPNRSYPPQFGHNKSAPARIYSKESSVSPHTPTAEKMPDSKNLTPPRNNVLPPKNVQTFQKPVKKPEEASKELSALSENEVLKKLSELGFGEDAVKLYGRIPDQGSISFDELSRGGTEMGELMEMLSSLEMIGAVELAHSEVSRRQSRREENT